MEEGNRYKRRIDTRLGYIEIDFIKGTDYEDINVWQSIEGGGYSSLGIIVIHKD